MSAPLYDPRPTANMLVQIPPDLEPPDVPVFIGPAGAEVTYWRERALKAEAELERRTGAPR